MAECTCSGRHSQNRQLYPQEQHPVLLYEFRGEWGRVGQIFVLDFHFSPTTNCCRRRRWYISWYVTSAPLLPGLISNAFKPQNHFPEFLNMTSSLSACRCHSSDCGNEYDYNYWTDFIQIWYRFMHIKSRQANTVLFHVVLISKPLFTNNS